MTVILLRKKASHLQQAVWRTMSSSLPEPTLFFLTNTNLKPVHIIFNCKAKEWYLLRAFTHLFQSHYISRRVSDQLTFIEIPFPI